MEESGASDRAGAARWLTMHDDLLRGMAHALSNRVGTILAVVSLLEIGESGAVQPIETLRLEADRLETLLQTLRHLPRRTRQSLEPILPVDVARAAIELQAHHPDGRDVVCDVHLDGDMMPAWGDAASIELAIAAALTGAKRHIATGVPVAVRISSTDDVVRFDVCGTIGGNAESERDLALDASAAHWLVSESGGRADTHASGIVIELPALAAIRRARKR